MAFIIIIMAITKSITFIVDVVVVGSGAVVLSSGHDYCQ